MLWQERRIKSPSNASGGELVSVGLEKSSVGIDDVDLNDQTTDKTKIISRACQSPSNI